jgi:hypothetical protein
MLIIALKLLGSSIFPILKSGFIACLSWCHVIFNLAYVRVTVLRTPNLSINISPSYYHGSTGLNLQSIYADNCYDCFPNALPPRQKRAIAPHLEL